jgi:hypothetical protein
MCDSRDGRFNIFRDFFATVVGVDLDYEVLGQGSGMLMVTVSGTAVAP